MTHAVPPSLAPRSTATTSRALSEPRIFAAESPRALLVQMHLATAADAERRVRENRQRPAQRAMAAFAEASRILRESR